MGVIKTRMTKLALGLNFYNDKAGLERLLHSIPPKAIDFIIAVDGIYQFTKEQNPDLPSLSNDGSRELLKNGRFDVRLLNCANQPEYVKRNRYLEYAAKIGADYLIICDSDEHFLYEDINCSCMKKRGQVWKRFRDEFERMVDYHQRRYNVFTMLLYDPVTKKKAQRPRCWYNPGQMRYLGGSHYHWGNIVTEKKEIEQHRQQKMMYTQYAIDAINFPELILVNDRFIRTDKEVNDRRELYQKYLVKYESLRQTNLNLEHEEAHQLAKMMLDQPAAGAAAATELLLEQLNKK